MIAVMGQGNGLIRYSAILRKLKVDEGPEFVGRFIAEVEAAGRDCDEHGHLDDPIIGVDRIGNRLVVGCPLCSGAEVLARWEAQE